MSDIFSDAKKVTKLLIVSIIIVVVGFFLCGYISYKVQMNKRVVPYKWDNKDLDVVNPVPGQKPYREVVVNEDSKTNINSSKTKYEQLIEKYTFGDKQYYSRLNLLLDNKLNDENKLYITLKNSSSLEKTTDTTCDKLLPNLNVSKTDNSYKVESNGVAGFCYSPTKYYDYNDLNKKYKELFGNDSNLPVIKGFIAFEGTEISDPYAYSDELGGYIKLSCNCGGTFAYPINFYRIIDTKETGNTMTIDIAYLKINYDKKNIYTYNSNSGNNYTFNSLDNSSNITYDSMIDSIYANEMSYLKKYRFNFNKGETEYYLVSIDNLN